MTQERNKKTVFKRILLIVLIIFLILCIGLASSFFVLRHNGEKKLLGKQSKLSANSSVAELVLDDGMTIVYNGTTYYYNEDAVSILFMGVDKTSISDKATFGHNGQADTIFVANIDTKTGKIKILPIQRESMVDINCYSVNGNFSGTEKAQICLAYAYAENGENACENVSRSVSRLLYGVEISAYYSIDLEGFKTLTDKLGGVILTSIEDIPEYNIKKGDILNLKGENAENYIRSRSYTLLGNSYREQRQKQFLNALILKARDKVKNNISCVPSLYNSVKNYSVTDLSLDSITYLVSCVITNGINTDIEYYSYTGDYKLGEFAEFYYNSSSVYEAVLNVFYKTEK